MTDTLTARLRTGNWFLALLRDAGIDAADVARNCRAGTYTVRFVSPDVSNFCTRGTDPARVWAQRIVAVLPGAEIVQIVDHVAEWRPNKPVLFATIFVRY